MAAVSAILHRPGDVTTTQSGNTRAIDLKSRIAEQGLAQQPSPVADRIASSSTRSAASRAKRRSALGVTPARTPCPRLRLSPQLVVEVPDHLDVVGDEAERADDDRGGSLGGKAVRWSEHRVPATGPAAARTVIATPGRSRDSAAAAATSPAAYAT